MSSATSINGADAERLQRPRAKESAANDLRPWHFFVLMSLVAATAAVVIARESSPEHLVLISLTIGAAGFAGAMLHRTLSPLVARDVTSRTDDLTHSMRAVMEREKMLVLRSIKDLEFDRAMGKLSAKDFDEMSARLRARAMSLMRQLDAGGGYGELIERELKARVDNPAARSARGKRPKPAPTSPTVQSCQCGAANDPDAAFCKRCGTKLDAGTSA